ncbi:MAG: nitrogen regulation protein NR(II) [Vicinamibacteria bacterium]
MPRRLATGRRASIGGLAEAVLDALPLGLYVVDRDLRVVAWNRTREQGAIGQPRRRVLGRQLKDVLPREGWRATEPVLRRVLATGAPHVETSETSAGSRLYRIARLPVIQDGRVTHVVSEFEDVTEQRALEMRVIASDRLAFLGQLVAGVAHEISNPLANLAGCSEALAEIGSRAPRPQARREARHFLGLVRRELARCEQLIRTLLEAARPGSSDSCSVQEVVGLVLRLLERHPSFARVEIVSRLPKSLPPAGVDADSLRQAVLALATNAAAAMAGHGRLSLRAGRLGGRLFLDVADDGPGVPPQARRHLFEPFYTTGAGAGLGLAIARSLLRRRGGDLVLRPARRGASFRAWLPPGTARRA